jgi:deazaflavin-dependent oxidoreductase (nitroreductase family)
VKSRAITPVTIDLPRRSRDTLQAESARPIVLVLTTTVNQTGELHTTALADIEDGPRFVVVATTGHGRSRPAGYRNLVGTPWGTVDIGSGALAIDARLAVGADRDWLLDQVRSTLPGLAELCRYPTKLRVIILTTGRRRPAESMT